MLVEKKALLLFGNSNVTTRLICLYHSDTQPAVCVLPGVQTRAFGVMRKKKLNNGVKRHIPLLSVECIYSFIHSFGNIQPQRPGWQEPEPSPETGVASGTWHPGQVLGGSLPLLPPHPLDVPTFTARCLYVRDNARDPSSERQNCGRERCPVIFA